jgi:hypothetical protein
MTSSATPRLTSHAAVIATRLDSDLRQAVEARAVRDHKNDSEVIRDALRAWV